jgi:site-specific DNA-methyltransferase (adenine-specific)
VAFEDTWFWNENTVYALETLHQIDNKNIITFILSLLSIYGNNDLMAYLIMMAVRLVEIERIIKQTGTLYLHCDTNVSHYLKILLDIIFGHSNFRNEISWLRSQPKSHASRNLSKCRDIILRYTKYDNFIFNKLYGKYDEKYLTNFYKYVDEDGRRYRLSDLTNPNKNRPNLTYEFLGVTRVWVWTKERMQKAYDEGLIVQAKPGAVPSLKRYLDERLGMPITDNWNDIEHLHSSNPEYLGYLTQKPLVFLERIISLSSNKGDVVMDPFCGCGTAIDAAESLERSWIGIDMSYLSIALVERRLRESYSGAEWSVYGVPVDLLSAKDLANRDKFQFQYWALDLVNAKPS